MGVEELISFRKSLAELVGEFYLLGDSNMKVVRNFHQNMLNTIDEIFPLANYQDLPLEIKNPLEFFRKNVLPQLGAGVGEFTKILALLIVAESLLVEDKTTLTKFSLNLDEEESQKLIIDEFYNIAATFDKYRFGRVRRDSLLMEAIYPMIVWGKAISSQVWTNILDADVEQRQYYTDADRLRFLYLEVAKARESRFSVYYQSLEKSLSDNLSDDYETRDRMEVLYSIMYHQEQVLRWTDKLTNK